MEIKIQGSEFSRNVVRNVSYALPIPCAKLKKRNNQQMAFQFSVFLSMFVRRDVTDVII